MAKIPFVKDVGRAMGFEFYEGERFLSELDQILKNLESCKIEVSEEFLQQDYGNFLKVKPEPVNLNLRQLPKNQWGKTTFEDMFRFSVFNFIELTNKYISNLNAPEEIKHKWAEIFTTLKLSLNESKNGEMILKLREIREKIFNLLENLK